MLINPRRFWNWLAPRYARFPVQDQAAYQHKLDATARHLSEGDNVLEIGCGTGTTALIHASRVDHIDAIDFSSGMIRIAREKAVAQGIGNVDFTVSALEDWPIPAKGYDAVLAMSILHLVRDLDETLDIVHRALKEDGLFFSSTTCPTGVARYLLPVIGVLGFLPRINILTPESLTARIASHGFAIEEVWQPNAKGAVFVVARRQTQG